MARISQSSREIHNPYFKSFELRRYKFEGMTFSWRASQYVRGMLKPDRRKPSGPLQIINA